MALPDANQVPNLLFEPATPGAPQSKLGQYLKPAAFAIPAPYTFGNAPRTLSRARGPALREADMSLFKTFSIRERLRFTFRVEAFNIWNNPEFSSPNANIESATFGNITSTSVSARQPQFGGKLSF